MGNGFMGRVLWVDLTSRTWRDEDVSQELIEQYMTGYGLAARLLFERMPAGVDPLGPDNILGFAAGILTGTAALFSGRYTIVGKSPQTGGWGDANSGGTLAPEIKKCGYDCIFFTGAASSPVYLLIDNDKISLEDADDLWGKDAFATDEAIVAATGIKRLKVATIGLSGENQCHMAGVVNDRGRIAARSGLGAVMGSKRLKAVALRGKGRVEVADAKALKALNKTFNSHIKTEGFIYPENIRLKTTMDLAGTFAWRLRFFPRDDALGWRSVLKRYGTMGVTAMSAINGDSPVKNWAGAGYRDFPLKRAHKISDEVVLAKQVKRYGCIGCPIKCGGEFKLAEGERKGAMTHKPEYETLGIFGSNLLIDDLPAILLASDRCNAYGLDTIGTGAVIAFAFEAWEKGIIGPEQTGGLELKWGDKDAMLTLIEQIARRQGIGDLLAQGVKRAAEELGQGSEAFAMHAGGAELPAHDSRYDPGFAVAYAAEPTPARHSITSFKNAELFEVDVRFKGRRALFTGKRKRYDKRGKAGPLKLCSNLTQVANGAGLCLFGMQMGAPMPLFGYLNAVTGWQWSDEQWLAAGHRIQNIRHAFNVREGITVEQTRCTPRAVGNPPMDKGPNSGVSLDEEAMIRDYYDEWGWDYPSGRPQRAKLEELGQHELVQHFYGE